MHNRVQFLTLDLDPLIDRPIVHVDDDPRLEGNVNGPSLIGGPSWADNPLGRYIK